MTQVPINGSGDIEFTTVEMRYKPERALTHVKRGYPSREFSNVEMRYKPERALTPYYPMLFLRIILE